MKQACVEAIAQTLGRQPKADELKGIEDRIKEAVRQVHKKMPGKVKLASLMRRRTWRPPILCDSALCMTFIRSASASLRTRSPSAG